MQCLWFDSIWKFWTNQEELKRVTEIMCVCGGRIMVVLYWYGGCISLCVFWKEGDLWNHRKSQWGMQMLQSVTMRNPTQTSLVFWTLYDHFYTFLFLTITSSRDLCCCLFKSKPPDPHGFEWTTGFYALKPGIFLTFFSVKENTLYSNRDSL